MAKLIVDTNFLVSCAKQKIDFYHYAMLNAFEILVPEQVITEITKIISSTKKKHDKLAASLALKLLSMAKYTSVRLNNNYVDRGIVSFAKENPRVVVATLDKEIQKQIKNPVLIIRGQNQLEIFSAF